VRQTTVSTAVSSILVCAIAWTVDWFLGGKVMGTFGSEILVYTLLCVNLDFWEAFWLSQQRTNMAFVYTSGRLALRVLTVLLVAKNTHNVLDIIHALLIMEAVRLVGSVVLWRTMTRPEGPSDRALWKLQLKYCIPLGSAQILATFNRYIGNILIARTIGAAGLAQYSVGTYAVPILYDMRNSVSDALLPRLARDAGDTGELPSLALWHRSNALFALLLIPTGVLLARYAELVVVTLFSHNYLLAVPVFQIYLISLLGDTIDFGVALRLLGITGTFVRGSILGTLINLVLLAALLPTMGIMGAILALMIDQFAVFFYYAYTVAKTTGTNIKEVLGLHVLLRVSIAAIVPLPLLLLPVENNLSGIAIAAASTAVYLAAFLGMLWLVGSGEVRALLNDARRVLVDLYGRKAARH